METKFIQIRINQEGDEALNRILKIANAEGGCRMNKIELVSWIVSHFEKNSFEKLLPQIQKDHFDQVAYLESILNAAKRAQKEGTSEELSAVLAQIKAKSRVPQRNQRKEGSVI